MTTDEMRAELVAAAIDRLREDSYEVGAMDEPYLANLVVGAVQAVLADKLEQEIRPLIRKDRSHEGGYDCCGCDTYDLILDHAIAIVRGEQFDGSQRG